MILHYLLIMTLAFPGAISITVHGEFESQFECQKFVKWVKRMDVIEVKLATCLVTNY